MSPQIVNVHEAAANPGPTHKEATAAMHTPAMVVETTPVAQVSTEASDGFFRLREWQVRCFNELSASHNWIINAPMAAGKSFQISAMAADRLGHDDRLKVIIAVPQTVIAAGFRLNRIEFPDGTRVEWAIRPELDLCSENASQSTKHLLKFLNQAGTPNHM